MGAGLEPDAKGTDSCLRGIASPDAMDSVVLVRQVASRPHLTGLISKQNIMPRSVTGVER